MKYYYMTPVSSVRSISNIGIQPRGVTNENLGKSKAFVSEGMTGTIVTYTSLQKSYDDVKDGKPGDVPEEVSNKIKSSKDLEDYLGGESVILVFDDSELEDKEDDDGTTSSPINPNKLSVCVVKNEDDGKQIYSRRDVINYMLSIVPVESIHASAKNVGTQEDSDKAVQGTVQAFYDKNKAEIDKYKAGNFKLETVDISKFLEAFFSREDSKEMEKIEREYKRSLEERAREYFDIEHSLDVDVKRREAEKELAAKEAAKERQERKK